MQNILNDHYCIMVKNDIVYWCGQQTCKKTVNKYIIEQQIFNNLMINFSSMQYDILENHINIQKQIIDYQKNVSANLDNKIVDLENKIIYLNKKYNDLYWVLIIIILLVSISFNLL